MNYFAIENLQLEEIKLLRQSLNVIQITGASAIFVATLQVKLDGEIAQIEAMILDESKKKEEGLRQIVENSKTTS